MQTIDETRLDALTARLVGESGALARAPLVPGGGPAETPFNLVFEARP